MAKETPKGGNTLNACGDGRNHGLGGLCFLRRHIDVFPGPRSQPPQAPRVAQPWTGCLISRAPSFIFKSLVTHKFCTGTAASKNFMR